MKLRERATFLKQFRHEFAATGAVQPSSRYLARAMTRPLRHAIGAGAASLRIIEMGPGTGAVTRAIAHAMRSDDQLDCFEINPRFAEFLSARVRSEPSFANVRDSVHVHPIPAQEAHSEAPCDFVICSVPLNNLDHTRTRDIFEAGRRVLGPDGTFTYFEYPLLPRLRAFFASTADRRRIAGVRAAKRRFNRFRVARHLVVRNIPPARAVHLQFP